MKGWMNVVLGLLLMAPIAGAVPPGGPGGGQTGDPATAIGVWNVSEPGDLTDPITMNRGTETVTYRIKNDGPGAVNVITVVPDDGTYLVTVDAGDSYDASVSPGAGLSVGAPAGSSASGTYQVV